MWQPCFNQSQYNSSACCESSCKSSCDPCGKSYKKSCCRPKRRSCKKSKKCCKRQCCPQYYPCIRTRCGFYSVMLTVVANPTQFATIEDVISYAFTVRNTGSEPICYPITIQTDKLGSTTIVPGYLAPGQSYTASALFTYTILAADILHGSYSITSTALVQVECDKILTSQQVQTAVTIQD